MPSQPNDARWLKAAAQLGLRGRPASSPNPNVGSIIVKNGRVIGRGFTGAGGRPHGEAMALDAAGDAAKGATLYTALEPCAHPSERGPTCSDLIAQRGIARVVFGVVDPDPRTAGKGALKLRKAGVEVLHLPCDTSAESICGFLTKQTLGRPHTTLKLAMSLDGFIALPSGESQWITGEVARAHVHSRRAMADAILVGGGTWRADQPKLDVRLPGLEDRSPMRVLLTRGVAPDRVKVINSPDQASTLVEVQHLYVEGGAETAASFLRIDAVDRLEIYRAPILLGHGKPALADFGLPALNEAHGRWALAEKRMLGSDTYEAYQRLR